MPTENNAQGTTVHPWMWVMALMCVVLGGAIYFFDQTRKGDTTTLLHVDIENAAASVADGSSFDIGRINKALTEMQPEDPEYLAAHSVLSAALFQGGDRDARIKAVEMVKERHSYSKEHGYSEWQAYSMNLLILYAVTAFDRPVTEAVFEGEFASLYDSEDIGASLARLAELSVRTYPTSDGYLESARKSANTLIDDYRMVRILSESERMATVSAIATAIQNADALYERDLASAAYQFFGSSYSVRYNVAKMNLYGAMALADKTHLIHMEDSFHKAIAASEGADAKRFINSTLPYVHLNRILYTRAASPMNTEVVKESLYAIVVLMRSDPISTRFFQSYMRTVGMRPSLGVLMTQKEGEALAAVDAGFKKILVDAGWKFE